MSTYQAKKNMAREEAIEWQEYARTAEIATSTR